MARLRSGFERSTSWRPGHDGIHNVGSGHGLSRPADRLRFARLLDLLGAQPDVEIVPASHPFFAQGCELHARRPDKDWSLTDCTSFIVMKSKGLEAALTADHHFAQAGFSVLMR